MYITLESALKEMYEKHYNITVSLNKKSHQVCPCFSECKGNFAITENAFFCNYNVKIGNGYGQKTSYPRVVVIGKESVRQQNNIEATEDAVNQHYKRTKAILAMLFSMTDRIVEDKIVSQMDFMYSGIPIYDLFCLTNHYHCAFKQNKKRHGISCTDIMWDNCADIVKEELAILKPQILVIQGGWSAKIGKSIANCKYIQKYFDKDSGIVKTNQEINGTDIDGLYWLIDLNGNATCCIIGSYHPSFHQWRNDKYLLPLENRIKIAKDWLKNQS